MGTERSDSHEEKFAPGLRYIKNGLLNSPPSGGRFRHYFRDALSTTKLLGE